MTVSDLQHRSHELRLAAERAESYDAIELLDSVDDTLSGPLRQTQRTLASVAKFLDQVEARLA